MSVLTFDSNNFEAEVLNSEKPVLVDFWAAWCGPCRMVGPVVEQLAQDYAGRIKVGKLNVDENRELAGRYRVMSIPTLAIFKMGRKFSAALASGQQHLVSFIEETSNTARCTAIKDSHWPLKRRSNSARTCTAQAANQPLAIKRRIYFPGSGCYSFYHRPCSWYFCCSQSRNSRTRDSCPLLVG